jgi:hypothetical protein
MKKFISLVLAAIFTALSLTSAVYATSFTQGYVSTSGLSVGTIVSLSKEGSNNIEPTTAENDKRTLGVVANAEGAIIDLQPQGSNIRVAINGDAKVLVSNSGGDIKKGDYLVISPLAGIAEKDNNASKASKYVGVAQESFTDSSSGAKKTNVQLNNGQQKEVAIGTITANIILSERSPSSNETSSWLAVIGERVTGRQVSPLRVLASSVVVISVLTLTGWILNASIRGSFVSLGRNPLAKSSIVTNLMRVAVIALAIFGIGMVAAYLILSL